ncbi:unnamed protein product, partial [Didymodactylos carnosus]
MTADTAVDDLAVNVGACPSTTMCDFESADQCGYVNDPSNNVDWIR